MSIWLRELKMLLNTRVSKWMGTHKNNKTIKETIKNNFCTGCGTCVGLCPNSSLSMIKDNFKGIYSPELINDKCRYCGLCFDCCPGHSLNFRKLNLETFGKESENVLIGNFVNCYIGHSTDDEIRYDSSSGGFITQLLVFALEEKIIDGALVTRMSKANPLEPEPFIARTREEIIEASKSKYCPVPANIALREIINVSGRFAVVGLPCHIQGIRKAELVNEELKEKIVLHFGLFCAATINFLGTEFLLQAMNIKKEHIKKIDYRGRGWPGDMSIELKKGNKIFIPRSKYYDSRFGAFVPVRCTLCSDHVCELADISFGDAWLPELTNDQLGTSIIISRNKAGEDFLQKTVAHGIINLTKVNESKVMQSQGMFRAKKRDLRARIFLFRLLKKKIPVYYNQTLLKPDFGSYLRAMWGYFWIFIASKRYLWPLLNIKEMISKIIGYFRLAMGDK